jgi:hypothetical protein
MTLRSILFATSTLAIAGAAFAQSTTIVSSTADDGPGSFRAALAEVAAKGGQIVLAVDGDIEITSSLAYAGQSPLTVIGNGQSIRAVDDFTLFAATEGASLTISNLTFEGPGGFDIENRGDLDGNAGKGIFVDVRDDQQGIVSLKLTNVTVSGVANHGIHMSDCNLADDCGGGGGGAGEGSGAGIDLQLTNVTVDQAGTGKFDADGLRVDERGAGSITAWITNSTFVGVGADGIELDEGQEGDVSVFMTGSVFDGNGNYCQPDLLRPFLPEQDEGEFEEGQAMPADIPQRPTGSADDTCLEYVVDLYDDGSVAEFEIAIDLDDAFDIDEAGPGSIEAFVTNTQILNSFDEGLDFDEEGAGDIRVTLVGTSAIGNTDDGYKHSEEGEGGVHAVIVNASANENGGVGFVFEEEDGGDVMVTSLRVATSGNDDGELGLEVIQDDDGTGALMITASDFADGIETEGVEQTNN